MLLDDGRVISNFIVQALRNEPITLYGDGTQTRSFMYIDDLINGMIAMMEQTAHWPGPVNLGNTAEYSIKTIAEKILQMLPSSTSEITYQTLPLDDPKQRQPDIALAKERLHWQPTIALEQGLEKTIAYFRQAI